MKIKYKDYGTQREYSVAAFVAGTIDSDYGGSGAVEQALHVARRNAEAIGRLVERLADMGVLGKDDVLKIADAYGLTDVELVEEAS